jgi:HEPN domain-containing protein
MEKAIINSLLRTAESDLKVSALLKQEGHYAQCIFYLQQSIEKAYKAAGMMTGSLTQKDLSKIGHNFLVVFKQQLELIYKMGPAHMKEMYENVFNENIETVDPKKIDPKRRAAFWDLSVLEINDWIDSTNDITGKANKELFNPEELERLKDLIKKHPQYSNEDQAFNFSKEEFETNKESLLKLLNSSIELLILGLITCAHSESTRYFQNKNGNEIIACPIQTYTVDSPLIVCFDKIHRIASSRIKDLKGELEDLI